MVEPNDNESAPSNQWIATADTLQGNPLSTTYRQAPSNKPLYPPVGVPRQLFIDIVRAACLIHALSGSVPDSDYMDPKQIKRYLNTRITLETITKVVESSNFAQAMVLRGVVSPTQVALSGEQMRALAVLTDITSHASLETKLKRAGIPAYKWNAWMNHDIFRAAHDRIAHDIFKKAASQIDSQVVSGALSGKLDFIKYYNEVSGRFSENRRAHADVQQILNDIIDIITRNVPDQAVLQKISQELSASVAKLG